MSKAFVFLVLVFAAAAGTCYSVSEDTKCKVLAARIDNRTLVVKLKNETNSDIVYWQLGNMWGEGSFYLVLKNRDTKEIVIARYGQAIYGRHQPDLQIIKKGDSTEFRIDLNCHKWGEESKALNDKSFEIKSLILSSEICEIAIRNDVFLDRLRFDFPSKE